MDKKMWNKIIASMMAGAMLIPSAAVFADGLSVEKIEIKTSDSQEFVTADGSLKESADAEDGMLTLSADTLVRMTLKLTDDNGAGVSNDEVSFLSYQNGEYADDKVQYLNQYTTNPDGTITIQFRPRESDPLGIYKAVANSMTAGANMTQYYKTARNATQPTIVTKEVEVSEGAEAVFTISGYSEDWMKTVTLSLGGTPLAENTDYTITADATQKTATLKFKTGAGTKMPLNAQPYAVSLTSSDENYQPINLKITVKETTYAVTYNGNGGTFTDGTAPVLNVTKSDLPKTMLAGTGVSKNGYVLAGWTKAQDGTGTVYTEVTAANFDEIFGSNMGTTLYAKWNLEDYTISYELNGGTNFAGAPAKYNIETETIKLGTPTKTDFIFGGWYDNADCNGSPITEIAKGSTGNKTLYAKWNEETSVTIRLDGSNVIRDLSGSVKFVASIGSHDVEGSAVTWHVGDASGDEAKKPAGVTVNGGVLKTETAMEWTPVTVWATNGDEISNKVTAYIDITEDGEYAIRGIDKNASTVELRKATDEQVYVVVALYNTDAEGNKLLVQAKVCPVKDQVKSDSPIGKIEVPGAFESASPYNEVRVFMWDSLDAMNPLCDGFVEAE